MVFLSFKGLTGAKVASSIVSTAKAALVIALLLSCFSTEAVRAGQTGRITGKALDGASGVALIGASVSVDSTEFGAPCDLEGVFVIDNVPLGKYSVTVSMLGYDDARVMNVEVVDAKAAPMIISLNSSTTELSDKVVVEARMTLNSEAALLGHRQRSSSVSDAISSEMISRSGSGNAADAMTRMTGASVVGGKYVYVRGLGDRYGNTQLNGVALPSADPEKQAANMDLLPAAFLDNIVVQKTFTADKPGNFTGGSVDVGTKDFPDNRQINFSSSSTHSSDGSSTGQFLGYSGATGAWKGYDDGSRALPTELRGVQLPYGIPRDGVSRKSLSESYNLFTPVMSPTRGEAPTNQNYTFSYGDQFKVVGRSLGVIASANYNRSVDSYEDGVVGLWALEGSDSNRGMTKQYLLNETRGSDEVAWGGMADITLRTSSLSKIGVNLLYNRNAESYATFLRGSLPRDLDPADVFETRALRYSQRDLRSAQLRGEHALGGAKGLRLDWKLATSRVSQVEPDQRFFANSMSLYDDGSGVIDTGYDINVNLYPAPARFWRDLSEKSRQGQVDFSLPVRMGPGRELKVRSGALFQRKTRNFDESRYDYSSGGTVQAEYSGNPNEFFTNHVGIVDSVLTSQGYVYLFGQYISGGYSALSSYSGTEDIFGSYGLIDVPLTHSMQFIGGLRFERTLMDVGSKDPTVTLVRGRGIVDTKDFLPSLTLIYRHNDKMNFRLAYGRTVARPTFREIAPYSSFDFIGGTTLLGNSKLRRSLVNNFDLRWEWFARLGEVFAVGAFYKEFSDPIEKAIVSIYDEEQFQNTPTAHSSGLEFEARTRLDRVSNVLRNVRFGGNFTLVKSRVDIAPASLAYIRKFDAGHSSTRSMQGQSPYVVNLDLSFDDQPRGTAVTVLYNVFGRRIDALSQLGTPDVVELPRHSVDFTMSQHILGNLNMKASAKNLLNAKSQMVIPFDGVDYVRREHSSGQTYGFGLSYSL